MPLCNSDPTTSEDQSTGALSLEGGSTKLSIAKGMNRGKQEDRVNITSNSQGANKITSKALEPAKLLKTVKSEADLKESRRQEKISSEKPPLADNIEANRGLSTSHRILLDL